MRFPPGLLPGWPDDSGDLPGPLGLGEPWPGSEEVPGPGLPDGLAEGVADGVGLGDGVGDSDGMATSERFDFSPFTLFSRLTGMT
ncbi:hypothetical protein N6H14_29775 [Paenibacillus sp. CC-CFT747]|nr:hypothetical protein N6H14_29775 [Paenibacillus sp. CC-CFT747]